MNASKVGTVQPAMAVIGDGIIGLSIALELARRGLPVTVFGDTRPGAATGASGGLLAPSVGAAHLPPTVVPFYFASRDLFPEYLGALKDPKLSVALGLLQPSDGSAPAERLESTILSKTELAQLEPALGHLPGAVLHTKDGVLDPVLLQRALRRAVESHPKARFIPKRVDALRMANRPTILAGGEEHTFERVVLAAGAWLSEMDLPTAIGQFVRPLKGQMVAMTGSPLSHAIMAEHSYLIPRGNTTIAGSTSEDAGFDTRTVPETIAALRTQAAELCPALADAPVGAAWAGLRPASPDFLPILGSDQQWPALLYACGHSRNGILLAPATAHAIADLTESKKPRWDLTPFSPSRFLA